MARSMASIVACSSTNLARASTVFSRSNGAAMIFAKARRSSTAGLRAANEAAYSAWIFERISPVLLIVASNCLIKHRQPAIGRKLPRGAGIVFDQLILFSENLNQNASLGHFIGVALAPLAKPETNSKLLDVFSLATISFSVSGGLTSVRSARA